MGHNRAAGRTGRLSMESNVFACPHCNGPFTIEQIPPSQAVACPHCGGAVAVPDQQSASEPWRDAATGLEESAAALDFLKPSVVSPAPPAEPTPQAPTSKLVLEPRSRIEQERRRTVRNLVLMTVGVIVLAVAVVVLSRIQP